MRRSGQRTMTRQQAKEKIRARRRARQRSVLHINIPAAKVIKPLRHIQELQANLKQIAGEYVNLESCPDAWLLLSVWDENWLRLTNPDIDLGPAQLLTLDAEINQIIMLLNASRAISSPAVQRMSEALSAVVESRAHAIYRSHGTSGLTVHIVPNFSKTYSSDRSRHLH